MSITEDLAEKIAERACDLEITVACAESLTSGAIASALGAASDASTWFAGGVVAYARHVKHEVLDVPEGPVVCAEAAAAMAGGVRRLTRSDVAVAVTGAGGPDPQDGQEPGTVFLGIADAQGESVTELHLDGEPAEVVSQTVDAALRALRDHLTA